MNMNQAFLSKIIYLVLVALLLFPIYRLGQPSTTEDDGGVLAQLRQENGMSQAQLGEIDPTSESIKLATLGLKAFAVNYLWGRAQEQKKKEEYDNMEVTVNQIITLQPNFVSVWEYQAHNLAYNVSIQFDNYRHRYQWVSKGINFLVKGTRFNRSQPRLENYTGWVMGHKIGKSDEKRYFRQIYRDDTDFHDELSPFVNIDDSRGFDARPDNWLTSRQWYLNAEKTVDEGGSLAGKMTHLVFYSHAPMARISYASALGEDGKFDAESRLAYERALQEWLRYGSREIPTPFGPIVLGQREKVAKEARELRKKVIAMKPELLKEIQEEKREALAPEMKEALATPEAARSDTQKTLVNDANQLTVVTTSELAERMPEDLREEAMKLGQLSIVKDNLEARLFEASEMVNYSYWRTRCEVEATDIAIEARRLVKEATDLNDRARPQESIDKFEAAWDKWAEVFKQYPLLMGDVMAAELMDSIEIYVRVLEQLERELPEDFKLRRLLEMHELNPNRLPEDSRVIPFQRPDYTGSGLLRGNQ